MWTADMHRCHACPNKGECADYKEIITALSGLTHKLNTDPLHVDGHGDGAIIVACQQPR